MNLDLFTVLPTATLFSALIKIDSNKKGFLIVTDENGKAIGTLTDGDIRRALIKSGSVNGTIKDSYNKNFKRVYLDEGFSRIIELFKNFHVDFLPILDKHSIVKNIITKNNMHLLLLEDIDFDMNYDFLLLDDSKLEHEIYDRPWGLYKTTFLNEYSQSKIIKVKPGGQLSLQEHKRREEYWVVITGAGEVTLGESTRKVESGSFVYIPKGCKHRLINLSEKASLMIAEVQLGDYFGEDDIIRFDDIYGRK